MTTENPDTPPQESFMSHLLELRNRLVKAALAILIIFLALSPFMKHIFDLLSHPLMVALPAGTKLLSTGVIAPFMVPLKVTLFVAFVLARRAYINTNGGWLRRSLFPVSSCFCWA